MTRYVLAEERGNAEDRLHVQAVVELECASARRLTNIVKTILFGMITNLPHGALAAARLAK